MKDFRQLRVWEKAHVLTLAVYKAMISFPNLNCMELPARFNVLQSQSPLILPKVRKE